MKMLLIARRELRCKLRALFFAVAFCTLAFPIAAAEKTDQQATTATTPTAAAETDPSSAAETDTSSTKSAGTQPADGDVPPADAPADDTSDGQNPDEQTPPEEPEDKYFGFFLSAAPLLGYEYGQIDEYVFYEDTNGRHKLSELNWELKPSFYGGGEITGGWRFISLSGYFTGTFPASSGSMYDSDWLNSGIFDYSTKTGYSYHNNKITQGYQWGVKLALSIPLGSKATITPFAAFDYKTVSFTASSGKYFYGNANSSTGGDYAWNGTSVSSGSLTGNVISYTWLSYLVWYGLSVGLKPGKLCLNLNASISPYAHIEAKDTHHLTNMTYIDIMEGYNQLFKFGLDATVLIGWRFSLYTDMNLLLSSYIYGTDYQSSNGSSYAKNTAIIAGTDINDFRVSVGISFRIF